MNAMRFTLYTIIFVIFHCELLLAIDPLEGNFPVVDCLEPRPITKCNETLLDAYKRSEMSKNDRNGNEADTRFYLYTCSNKHKPEFLHLCGDGIPDNSNYRIGKPLIYIVPGYISAVCTMAVFREMKNELLKREDCNVILADWPWGNGYDYYSASQNTHVVGNQIAFLTQKILNKTGDSYSVVHIIGHSLGAHIAGFAGKKCFPNLIRRITGLDPAGVNFNDEGSENRLHHTDAQMVDIIHSNAGKCVVYALGIPFNIGHADFYPNGGTKQPSCYVTFLNSLVKLDTYYAFVLLIGPFCPHFQSVEYFKSTINSHSGCNYVAVKCNSYKEFKSGACRLCGENGENCAVMGMDWELYPPQNKNATTNQSYYLDTEFFCPYNSTNYINRQGFPCRPVLGTIGPPCPNSSSTE